MLVTGQTNSSRLNELKKFIVTSDITKQYFGNGSWTNNGVDFTQLEYSDVDAEYRSYGANDGELRIYDGDDDFRVTQSPQLIKIVYYINGIKYTDYIDEGVTTFEYTAVGTGNTANFINLPYYKDPKKENIISSPKINNDVFIIRQQLSAFEKNNLLEYIGRLSELETFAGGNYFNIVNNT